MTGSPTQLSLLSAPPTPVPADYNRVPMRWTGDAGDVGFHLECPACGYDGWFSRRSGVTCDQCARSMRATADIEGPYRYSLTREWAPECRPMVVIGVNPSTADATTNDPTIRRCLSFAWAAGCGSLVMVNVFARRATDVTALRLLSRIDARGPRHTETLTAACSLPRALVVCAWGTPAKLPPTLRDEPGRLAAYLRATGIGTPLHVFRLTKAGDPEHPLYLPATCRPEVW